MDCERGHIAPPSRRRPLELRADRLLLAFMLCFAISFGSACQFAGGSGGGDDVDPIRVTQAVSQGDPARRASMRLSVQGLEADAAGEYQRAQGSFERAIQVDPTNPYAYLALARHHVDAGDAATALQLLDQAAALFESQGMREPRVGVHLMGLRGRAYHATGRSEDAEIYLERARELSPSVWGDGYLSPEELL